MSEKTRRDSSGAQALEGFDLVHTGDASIHTAADTRPSRIIEFIRFSDNDTLSFRQIDERNGVPKGTAFRNFKRRRHLLVEGDDYFYLPAQAYGETIDRLRDEGRIYPTMVHLVLITERGYSKLIDGNAGA